MAIELSSKVALNNGIKMPYLGLGVYLIQRDRANEVFNWAIDLGYRLFDTAAFYGNEAEVGKAIRESSIPRKDLFITTKLWNSDHGFNRAIKAFEKSFKLIGLEYIDLYLIHWPVGNLRKDSWKALEEIYTTGQVKAIGVSNYMKSHLEELLDYCEVVPAINQVEFHPWLYREDLLEFCKENQIQLEAYSPLTKGQRLNDPILRDMAKKYGKTPAQILIRWCLEHKIVTIPKSSNRQRLQENIEVFDFSLSQEDMKILDSIKEEYVSSWDSRTQP
ncbi:MAG: aldo/keto reductase [Candidatus Hodarchaeales archaeon]